MKKKKLVCKNENFNGSSCPRCLMKQNFLEFPAYEFSTEEFESNCDTCNGELSWETTKDKTQKYPVMLISFIALGTLLSSILFFMLRGNSSQNAPAKEDTSKGNSLTIIDSVSFEDTTQIYMTVDPPQLPVSQAVENPNPEQRTISSSETKTKSENKKRSSTINLPDGNKYTGEMEDGVPHGMGTITFTFDQQISSRDIKQRMAVAGDYMIGEFYRGRPVWGKLYDSGGKLKESIQIGR